MYSHILHATDLSENHFTLCQQAADIAKCFNAKLYLLHVIEPPATLQLAQGLGFAEFTSPIKDDAQAVLAVIGDALGIPVEQQFVDIGPIKTHVLAKAHELDCKLIIIGSHTPSLISALTGNTTKSVTHDAQCDVLTLWSK